MTRYIIHKRFKGNAICGQVNLPYGTVCDCKDGVLMYNGQYLCFVGSENSHQHLAIDEDGNGLRRGALTRAIMQKLSKRDDKYQARWDKIWEDEICQRYKRGDYADYWLWNHEFFSAPIEDLLYIAALIGVREEQTNE